MRKMAFGVFLMLLMGCMAANKMTDFRKEVSIEEDNFNNTIEIAGIEQPFDYSTGNYLNYHMLRTIIEKEADSTMTQIYVVHHYFKDNWEDFIRATFQGGQDADFINLDQIVIGCSEYGCEYNEDLGVFVTTDFLRENKNGISIKFYARSGSQLIVNVTPPQIEAQIKTIDSLMTTNAY